jgi:hypothetical protein
MLAFSRSLRLVLQSTAKDRQISNVNFNKANMKSSTVYYEETSMTLLFLASHSFVAASPNSMTSAPNRYGI